MQKDTTSWTTFRNHRIAYRWHPATQSRAPIGAASAPIVFLGGAFQSMESWKRFVDFFAPRSDVLLVDLPGSGAADPLAADEPVSLLSDALAHVLELLDLDRVYVIAASYGTPVAFQFAQRHPARVDRMVLCGTMKEIPQHERLRIERSVCMAQSGDLEGLARACVAGLLTDDPERPVRRSRVARRVLSSGVRSMTPACRVRYALNSTRLLNSAPLDLDRPPGAPCLLFTGEHDRFTTPDRVREVAASIPGAAFTLIPESDHLCHIEQFDVVVELLERFRTGTLQETPSDHWPSIEWTAKVSLAGEGPTGPPEPRPASLLRLPATAEFLRLDPALQGRVGGRERLSGRDRFWVVVA